MPDNYGTSASLAGLQTRSMVQQQIQNQLASGGPLKSKFFNKAKLQLLFDFLSYQQVPCTQPVKFG